MHRIIFPEPWTPTQTQEISEKAIGQDRLGANSICQIRLHDPDRNITLLMHMLCCMLKRASADMKGTVDKCL